MDNLQSRMMTVLRQHKGKRNAISSTEIAMEVGISESNGNPNTRFEIRDLMRETGTPIGSCPDGYFVIETRAELEEYVEDLQSRIDGIGQRIDLVQECFDEREPLQPAQTTLTEVES